MECQGGTSSHVRKVCMCETGFAVFQKTSEYKICVPSIVESAASILISIRDL